METSTSTKIPGKVWFRTSVAGMASYLDAAAIITTGTALTLYIDPLGITDAQLGQYSALLTFMIAVGALIGGRLGDLYGRRRVFLATMGLYTVGALVMTVAAGPASLYVGVILLGLAVGADLPVSLAMIAEEAPPGKRGRLVSFSHILWLLGIIVSQALGVVFGGMGQTGGRLMFLHLVVFAVITMILRAGMPESSRWTELHERTAGAGAATADPGTGAAADAAPDSERVDLGTLKQLLTGPFLAPTLAVAIFYSLVNVGANTGGQFNAFLYTEIAGSTVQVASAVSLVSFGISFASTFVLMKIVDGRNRMRWFAVTGVIYTAAYVIPALLGVHLWTLVLMGILGALGGAVAGEPMFKIWAQELIPTAFRSTAQGAMIAAARVVAAVVALWTPMLLRISPAVMFLFVAACIAVAALIGLLWITRFPRVADAEDVDGVEPAGGVPATGGSATPQAADASSAPAASVPDPQHSTPTP